MPMVRKLERPVAIGCPEHDHDHDFISDLPRCLVTRTGRLGSKIIKRGTTSRDYYDLEVGLYIGAIPKGHKKFGCFIFFLLQHFSY